MMTTGASQLPVQPPSTRAGWQDAGWVGTVRKKPVGNAGERYHCEPLGLLHNPDYAARRVKKLAASRDAEILAHEEGEGTNETLMVCRDDDVGGVHGKATADVIAEVLAP